MLRTDGEIVSEVEPHIGYLHRCAEKIGENLTPRQWVPYTDRMDYLAAMSMNVGWALTVEKLLEDLTQDEGVDAGGDDYFIHDLQEKASEVTLKLNTAVDMIRKSRGN